ncbi:MAG: hypothetical protein GX061_03995 [Eubacteriaceae bacterium]|nr:hypothetical protein [Eubacteriaceae bacterium]
MRVNIPALYLNKLQEIFPEEMSDALEGNSLTAQRAYQSMIKKARLKHSRDTLLSCLLNYLSGLAHYEGGQYKKAVAYQMEALNFAAACGDEKMGIRCRCALSEALLAMGEHLRSYQAANDALNEASRLKTGEQTALYALGKWHYETGNSRKAASMLKKALKSLGGESFTEKEEIILALGWACYRNGDYEGASRCTDMIEDYGKLPRREVPMLLCLDMFIDIKKGESEQLVFDFDALSSWIGQLQREDYGKLPDMTLPLEAFIKAGDAPRIEKLVKLAEGYLSASPDTENSINIHRLKGAYYSYKKDYRASSEELAKLTRLLEEYCEVKIASVRQAYEAMNPGEFSEDTGGEEGGEQ